MTHELAEAIKAWRALSQQERDDIEHVITSGRSLSYVGVSVAPAIELLEAAAREGAGE